MWETDLHNPHFASFAKLCGGKGTRVTDAGEFAAAFEKALNHNGPALVEIITDAELV